MSRVTLKQLELLVERINKTAGTPMTYCDKRVMPFKAHIGHYYLDQAYGGVKLVQVDNDGGGINEITRSGFTTKSKLFDELRMYLEGMLAKKEAA